MDIDLLSRMIGELILDHDSIGLPGLGAFVAEVVPASFSDRGYTINPPYRRLSFRQGRVEDDTLSDFYAVSNALDKTAAKAIVAEYLSQLKEVLKTRKTVVFPGLGRLRATKENTFFFVPDENLDIFPDGIGLGPISLKTHEETPEELSAAVSNLSGILSSPLAETAAPAAEPQPEPAEEPLPEAAGPDAAEPASEPQSEPAAEPLPEPVPEPAHSSYGRPERKKKSRWWVWPVVLISLALIALAVFLILVEVAPAFIDSILYTPEELRIIDY